MRSSNDFWFWVVVALIIMSLQVTGTIVRFLVSPPGLVICGIIFLIFLILKSSSGGDSQLPAESSTPTEDMRAQALAEQEAALEVAREAARERAMSSTLEIIHKYHIISAQISAWEKPF